MEKLSVKYLGFNLKSPLIVSSSRLTSKIDNLRSAEEYGAGAVVLKSLFEEQINHHISAIPDISGYPEANDYISNYTRSQTVGEYLHLITEARKTLSIPVIASINCYTAGAWVDFAKKIEESGADALEINVFFLPHNRKQNPEDSEKIYLDLMEKLSGTVKIPVSVKLGFRFSNILNVIDNLYVRGARGVVMFNRFYEPDIDIHEMSLVPAAVFSNKLEMRYVLRWIAMASSQDIRMDISASTGVNTGEDAVKYLLAGANTVQVCSVLYEKGLHHIKTMNKTIETWMDVKGFRSVNEFRGKLNYRNTEHPAVWERTQFMKYFSSED